MKIAILSRKESFYSTSRIVEASKKRGHQVDVLDTLKTLFPAQKGADNRPESP